MIPPTSTIESSDETLVEAVQAGHRNALFDLDRRWRRRLVDVARSVLRDDDLAQDVAQLALWRAYLNLHRYDTSRPFEPWILAIARNCARDLLRRQKAPPLVSHGGSLGQIANSRTGGADPATRREQIDALRACIAELGERSRTVVALSLTGFSLSEIGRALRKPKNTVQSWLEKAREQLRRCLAAKGFLGAS